MDKNALFEDFEKAFLNNKVRPLNEDPNNEIWIIKYNGKQLSLGTSGKTHWKTLGHAKAALTDKIKYPIQKRAYNNGIGYRETESLYKEFIQHLQDKGILEFIKI